MGGISAETHQFHRKRVPGDNKCLFWSFIFGIRLLLKDIFGDMSFDKTLMEVLNGGLRVMVADYIRSHSKLQEEVLLTFPEYKTIEEYYSELEQGILWGGEPELKALSDLYNIIICVINLVTINKKNCLLPLYYGQDNHLASKCIYIYYNGSHYDPLYLMNKKNTNEIETYFDPNDQTVNDLLKKFIKEKLHHNGDVELGLNIGTHMNGVSRPRNDSNQTKSTVNPFLPNELMKRKVSVIDEIPMSSNNNKTLPIPISNEYYDRNKRVKIMKYAAEPLQMSSKNNSDTMKMEELMQADTARGEFGTQVNEKQTTDLPMVLNDEYQKEKIEVKQKPGNKLDDGIQQNDTLNDNSESSS